MYKRYFENEIRNKNKENLNNIFVIIKKSVKYEQNQFKIIMNVEFFYG